LYRANKLGLDCFLSCSFAAEWFSFAVLSTAKEKDTFLCALCGSAVNKFFHNVADHRSLFQVTESFSDEIVDHFFISHKRYRNMIRAFLILIIFDSCRDGAFISGPGSPGDTAHDIPGNGASYDIVNPPAAV
jgi:hypothetical protein